MVDFFKDLLEESPSVDESVELLKDPDESEDLDYLKRENYDSTKDWWTSELSSMGIQVPDVQGLLKSGQIKEEEAVSLIEEKYQGLQDTLAQRVDNYAEHKDAFERYIERDKNNELGEIYSQDDNWLQSISKDVLAGAGKLVFEDDKVNRVLGVGQADSFWSGVGQGALEGVGQLAAPAAAGAAVGSVVPILGTAVGATVGSLAGLGMMAWKQFSSNYDQALEATGSTSTARNAAVASIPAIGLDTLADGILLKSASLIKGAAKGGIKAAAKNTLISSGTNIAGKLKFASSSATRKGLLLQSIASQTSGKMLANALKTGAKGAALEGIAEAGFGTYLNNELMDLAIEGDYYDPTTKESLLGIAQAGLAGAAAGQMITSPINYRQQVAEKKLANDALNAFATNKPFTFPAKDKELAEEFAKETGSQAIELDGRIKIIPNPDYFTAEEKTSVQKSVKITEDRLAKVAEPFEDRESGSLIRDPNLKKADPLKTPDLLPGQMTPIEILAREMPDPKDVEMTQAPLASLTKTGSVIGKLPDEIRDINVKIGQTKGLIQTLNQELEIIKNDPYAKPENIKAKETEIAEAENLVEKTLLDRRAKEEVRLAAIKLDSRKTASEARTLSQEEIPADLYRPREVIEAEYLEDKKVASRVQDEIAKTPKTDKVKYNQLAASITDEDAAAVTRYLDIRGPSSSRELRSLLSSREKANETLAKLQKQQEVKDSKALNKVVKVANKEQVLVTPELLEKLPTEERELLKISPTFKGLLNSLKAIERNLLLTKDPKSGVRQTQEFNKVAGLVNKIVAENPNVEGLTKVDLKSDEKFQTEIARKDEEATAKQAERDTKKSQAEAERATRKQERATKRATQSELNQKFRAEREAKRAASRAAKENVLKARSDIKAQREAERAVVSTVKPKVEAQKVEQVQQTKEEEAPKIAEPEIVETPEQIAEREAMVRGEADAKRVRVALEKIGMEPIRPFPTDAEISTMSDDQIKNLGIKAAAPKPDTDEFISARKKIAVANQEDRITESNKLAKRLTPLNQEQKISAIKALANWVEQKTKLEKLAIPDLYGTLKSIYNVVPKEALFVQDDFLAQLVNDVRQTERDSYLSQAFLKENAPPSEQQQAVSTFFQGVRESLEQGIEYLQARGVDLSNGMLARLLGEESDSEIDDNGIYMMQARQVMSGPKQARAARPSTFVFANRILNNIHLDKSVEILELDIANATTQDFLDRLSPSDREKLADRPEVLAKIQEGISNGVVGMAFPMRGLGSNYVFFTPQESRAQERFIVAHEIGEVAFRQYISDLSPTNLVSLQENLQREIGELYNTFQDSRRESDLSNLQNPYSEGVRFFGSKESESLTTDAETYALLESEYFANQFARSFLNQNYFPDNILGNLAKSLRNLWLRIRRALNGVNYMPNELMQVLERDLARRAGVVVSEFAAKADVQTPFESSADDQIAEMRAYRTEKQNGIKLVLDSINNIFENSGVDKDLQKLGEKANKEIPSGEDIAVAMAYLTGATNTQILIRDLPQEEKALLQGLEVVYSPDQRVVALDGGVTSRNVKNVLQAVGQTLYHNILANNKIPNEVFEESAIKGASLSPNLRIDPKNLNQSNRYMVSGFGSLFADFMGGEQSKLKETAPSFVRYFTEVLDSNPELRKFVLTTKGVLQKARATHGTLDALTTLISDKPVKAVAKQIYGRSKSTTKIGRVWDSIVDTYRGSIDPDYKMYDLLSRQEGVLARTELGREAAKSIFGKGKIGIIASRGLVGNINRIMGNEVYSTFRTIHNDEIPNLKTILKDIPLRERDEFEAYLLLRSLKSRKDYNNRLKAEYDKELALFKAGRRDSRPTTPQYITDDKWPIKYEDRTVDGQVIFGVGSLWEQQTQKSLTDSTFATKLDRFYEAAEKIYDLQEASNDFVGETVPGALEEIEIIGKMPRDWLPLWDNSVITTPEDEQVLQMLRAKAEAPNILKSFGISEKAEAFIPPTAAFILRTRNRLVNAQYANRDHFLLQLLRTSNDLGVGIDLGIRDITPNSNATTAQKTGLQESAKALIKKQQAYDKWLEGGRKRQSSYPVALTEQERNFLFETAARYPVEAFSANEKAPKTYDEFQFITVKTSKGTRILSVPTTIYNEFLTKDIAQQSTSSIMKPLVWFRDLVDPLFKRAVIGYRLAYYPRAIVYDFNSYYLNSREYNPLRMVYSYFSFLPGIFQLREALGIGNASLERQIMDMIGDRVIAGHSIVSTPDEEFFGSMSSLYSTESNAKKAIVGGFKTVDKGITRLMFEFDKVARAAEVVNWMRHNNISIETLGQLTPSQMLEAISVAKRITVDYTRRGNSELHRWLPFFGTSWNVFHNSLEQASDRFKDNSVKYMLGRLLPAALVIFAAKSMTKCGENLTPAEKVNGIQICTGGGMYNVKFGNPLLIATAMMSSLFETGMKDIAPVDKRDEMVNVVVNSLIESTGVAPSSVSPSVKALDSFFTGGQVMKWAEYQLGLSPGTPSFRQETQGVFDAKTLDTRLKRVLTDTLGQYGDGIFNAVMAGVNMDSSFVTPRSWFDFGLKQLGATPPADFRNRSIWRMKQETIAINKAYARLESKFDASPNVDTLAARQYNSYVNRLGRVISAFEAYGYDNPAKKDQAREISAKLSIRGLEVIKEFKKSWATDFSRRSDAATREGMRQYFNLIEEEVNLLKERFPVQYDRKK